MRRLTDSGPPSGHLSRLDREILSGAAVALVLTIILEVS